MSEDRVHTNLGDDIFKRPNKYHNARSTYNSTIPLEVGIKWNDSIDETSIQEVEQIVERLRKDVNLDLDRLVLSRKRCEATANRKGLEYLKEV